MPLNDREYSSIRGLSMRDVFYLVSEDSSRRSRRTVYLRLPDCVRYAPHWSQYEHHIFLVGIWNPEPHREMNAEIGAHPFNRTTNCIIINWFLICLYMGNSLQDPQKWFISLKSQVMALVDSKYSFELDFCLLIISVAEGEYFLPKIVLNLTISRILILTTAWDVYMICIEFVNCFDDLLLNDLIGWPKMSRGSLPVYFEMCPPPRDMAALQKPYGRVTKPTFQIPRLQVTNDCRTQNKNTQLSLHYFVFTQLFMFTSISD